MIQGFYSAATALNYRQKGINVTANNIANMNTTAFKGSNPIFANAMYVANQKEYPDNVNTEYHHGTGAYISSVAKDMSQGTLVHTRRIMDISIAGKGFLGVGEDPANIFYTRGGSFFPEPSPGGKMISLGGGNRLLNEDGEPVVLPYDVEDITITEDGLLFHEGQDAPIRLLTVTFDDPEGLEMYEKGLFRPTQASGGARRSEIVIRQGYLEASNVDMAKEMTDLIKHQRIFQLNARVLTTIDEMASIANKLRR